MCNTRKPASEFHAKQSKCKSCQVDYNRQKRRDNSSIQTDDHAHIRGWLAEQSEEHLVEKITDLTNTNTTQVLKKLDEILNTCEKSNENLLQKIECLESRNKNTVKIAVIGLLLLRFVT